MTKSKVFIVGALLVVATCGAFATKAVNKLVPTTIWYTNSLGVCVSVANFEPAPCQLNASLPDNCTKPLAGADRTIYQTTNSSGVCINPFKTEL